MAAEYLAIARVRYGSRLNVVEECDQAMKSVPVPSMLLQPLLENAVTAWHRGENRRLRTRPPLQAGARPIAHRHQR